MYKNRGKSKWKLDSSVMTSIDVLWATGGSGTLSLTDPDGNGIDFSFTSYGVGKGAGSTISDWDGKGKGNDLDFGKIGIDLPFDLSDRGAIWLLDNFSGKELKESDFVGVCFAAEIGIGAIGASVSGVGILLGIPLTHLPKELLLWGAITGGLRENLLDILAEHIPSLKASAKAVLLLGGLSVGYSVGGSVKFSIGEISRPRTRSVPVRITEMPTDDPKPTQEFKKNQKIVLAGNALFDWDKDVIKQTAAPLLTVAANVILANPNRRFVINGHTDKTEKKPGYNQALSLRRAQAVWGWLAGFGVNVSKIGTQGFGHTELVDKRNTEEAHERNRRVEILMLPD